MACGTLRLRTMEGVARPALAAVVPREGGHFVLIDAGANPEAKPEHLVHNSILGSHYCRVMLGIPSPRVGLMSIGTEDGKGNSLITETNDLPEEDRRGIIPYSGPIGGVPGVYRARGRRRLRRLCRHKHHALKKLGIPGEVHPGHAAVSELGGEVLRMRSGRAPFSRRAPMPRSRTGSIPSATAARRSSVCAGNILKAHGSPSNRNAIKMLPSGPPAEIIKADMNQRMEADIARANDVLIAPVAS